MFFSGPPAIVVPIIVVIVTLVTGLAGYLLDRTS